MNETKHEQLSAFMDDETEGRQQELVDDLLRDPELLDTWSRYHLISDCLQRNMPAQVDRELPEKVAAALESEPAILAPTRFPATVVKPVAGFAIAASVAALAIFGIQQQQVNAPQAIPGNVLLDTVPGAASGGGATAPARQVSAGSGMAGRECETPEDRAHHDEADTTTNKFEEDCR